MARPLKTTIEYFPHMTEHGKTLFILESKWGNDGYTVWFKLLEWIGSSDGLYLDLRESSALIYRAALARVPESTLLEILDMLANLDAIDRDLWKHKLVYCQHLVDNVADAFKRRKQKLPTRDSVIFSTNIVIADINGVNAGISTQREIERENNLSRVVSLEAKDQTKAFIPVETVDNPVEIPDKALLEAQARLVEMRQNLERRGEDEKQNPSEAATVLEFTPNAGVG